MSSAQNFQTTKGESEQCATAPGAPFSFTITLRPVNDDDLEFLYRLYASGRFKELAATAWSASQVEEFLRMQFRLQHTQYRQNYPGASFDIVLIDRIPAGRLYLDRKPDRMRLIDITLLPEFRGRGIGGRLMRELADEADAKGVVMSLHVEMNNPVREFYKALGFREKELRGIYYYMERRGGETVQIGTVGNPPQ